MKVVPLGVTVVTMAATAGLVFYIKHAKRKLRRFVLRNDEVSKYSRD